MKVQLFGNLADLANKNQVEVESQSSTDMLVDLLVSKYPELKDYQFLVSVNHEVVSDNRELQQDDEIALLPPFSGG